MTNKMKYLESFRNNLMCGTFKGSEREPYLESINPDIGVERYDMYDKDIKRTPEIIMKYIGEQLNEGKVLPFDNIKCVEDKKSVVFIENHPDKYKTIIITTYTYNTTGNYGLLLQGEIRFMNYNPLSGLFGTSISEIYRAIIDGDRLFESSKMNPIARVIIAADLNESFIESVFELNYIEENKLKPERVETP